MQPNVLQPYEDMFAAVAQPMLLFSGETLLLLSPEAKRLFPAAAAPCEAEVLFGTTLAALCENANSGSFSWNTDACTLQASFVPSGEYRLVTLSVPMEEHHIPALNILGNQLRHSISEILSRTPQIFPDADPEQSDNIAAINRQLYSLLRLSGHLQQLRPLSSHAPAGSNCIDISTWLSQFADWVAPLCESTCRTFCLQTPNERLLCRFDHALLTRALTNLLSNAIKFSDPGSTITLSVKKYKNTIRLSLKDEGSGIPPEVLSALFESRLYSVPSLNPQHGSGLGLPLTRQYMQAMGGTLMVETREGKGTTVHLSLPASSKKQPLTLESPKYVSHDLVMRELLTELSDALPAELYGIESVDL